jgi:hypothetical protein
MELLRVIVSLLFFVSGVYLLIDGLIPDVDWYLLLMAAGAFLFAYAFWPSKRRGQREEANSWLDLIEIFVELPIEIFLWVFRLCARLFKDGDAGVDL